MQRKCFVIMPFHPELHYMYLFIQQHIEQNFNIKCERGDSKVLTVSILDKILKYIKQSDIIIADCSGRNPNVFYELGMAHVLEKDVILITSDDVKEAPTDIKSFEFIHYKLDDHKGFCNKLDSAINNILGDEYTEYYKVTFDLFKKFQNTFGFNLTIVEMDNFTQSLSKKSQTTKLPDINHESSIAESLIPLIVNGNLDIDKFRALDEWIKNGLR